MIYIYIYIYIYTYEYTAVSHTDMTIMKKLCMVDLMQQIFSMADLLVELSMDIPQCGYG